MAFFVGPTVSTLVRQIWLLRHGSRSIALRRIPDLNQAPLAVLRLRKHGQVQTVLHTSVTGVAGAEDRVAEVNP